MYSQTFLFGTKLIQSNNYFSEEIGHGFINFHSITGCTEAEKALQAGGWTLRKSAEAALEEFSSTTECGVTAIAERAVLVYKIIVPNYGTYRISFKAIAPSNQPIEHMDLYCGRRNLVEHNISVKAGETYTRNFYASVTAYIPALSSIPNTEKAIYISVCGLHATISEIIVEEKTAPTLFIAGDSTLTDQSAPFPYYPHGSCGGWAQIMLSYFDSMAVCNQAHSGLTTNCFRDDGHWDIVKNNIKPGDIVMIQFGHNDQKRRNLSAFGGYINNLRWYCSQIKSFGATPIIISPISRIPIKDGTKFYSLLQTHALACKTAAEECNVPFIDLHALTFDYLCTLGETAAKEYFNPGDITHTNDFGAYKFASFVISEILNKKIEPIVSFISITEKSEFLPSSDTKTLPVEPSGSSPFDIHIPYVDIEGIPQYEFIEKAFKLGLLDPCIMHLHPTDIMPRAQFLMIYFKAIKMNGTRPYSGYYCDLSKSEWDSSYVETCLNENLIDSNTTNSQYFRPDDPLTYGEFASFLIRASISPKNDRNIGIDICYEKAKTLDLIPFNVSSHDFITRADCYKGLVVYMDKFAVSDQGLPSDVELHPVR